MLKVKTTQELNKILGCLTRSVAWKNIFWRRVCLVGNRYILNSYSFILMFHTWHVFLKLQKACIKESQTRIKHLMYFVCSVTTLSKRTSWKAIINTHTRKLSVFESAVRYYRLIVNNYTVTSNINLEIPVKQREVYINHFNMNIGNFFSHILK